MRRCVEKNSNNGLHRGLLEHSLVILGGTTLVLCGHDLAGA